MINKVLLDKQIIVNGKTYNYKFYYGRKWSISISINKKNEIVVRGSRLFTASHIEQYVAKNIVRLAEYIEKKTNNTLIDINEYLTILGKRYKIEWILDKKKYFIKQDEIFYIHIKNDTQINRIKSIKEIYDSLTKDKINELSQYIENCFKILKLKETPILSKWMIGRWGYCAPSIRKVVISNLAIAIDEELIKYLIVHEISHLVRGAHDKKFWNTVATIMPEYKINNKKLRCVNIIKK